MPKFYPRLSPKDRAKLSEQGRQLRARIEELGTPKIWGTAPAEILGDVKTWQHQCSDAGLSSASLYGGFGSDDAHTSGADVLLVVDETMLILDPPGSVGG